VEGKEQEAERSELTPEQIRRKAQIEIMDEMVEAQKAFHRKTASYVMSLDYYKRIRAALSEEPEDPEHPWEPVQGDMFMGYPIMVTDDVEDDVPRIELVDKDLRPPYYAGVTSLGIERKDMEEPKFEAAAAPDSGG
jgi:hypothetical protein